MQSRIGSEPEQDKREPWTITINPTYRFERFVAFSDPGPHELCRPGRAAGVSVHNHQMFQDRASVKQYSGCAKSRPDFYLVLADGGFLPSFLSDSLFLLLFLCPNGWLARQGRVYLN